MIANFKNVFNQAFEAIATNPEIWDFATEAAKIEENYRNSANPFLGSSYIRLGQVSSFEKFAEDRGIQIVRQYGSLKVVNLDTYAPTMPDSAESFWGTIGPDYSFDLPRRIDPGTLGYAPLYNYGRNDRDNYANDGLGFADGDFRYNICYAWTPVESEEATHNQNNQLSRVAAFFLYERFVRATIIRCISISQGSSLHGNVFVGLIYSGKFHCTSSETDDESDSGYSYCLTTVSHCSNFQRAFHAQTKRTKQEPHSRSSRHHRLPSNRRVYQDFHTSAGISKQFVRGGGADCRDAVRSLRLTMSD